MRYLIPFGLEGLGFVEAAWLLVVFGGLSLLVPPKKPRWIGALVVAAILGIYVWADAETGSSNASLVQRIAVVAIGAAAMLAGSLRPQFEAVLGSALAPVWIGMALVLTALGPFGQDVRSHGHEWLFLFAVLAAVAAILRAKDAVPLVSRFWMVFALGFLLLCGLARPFGIGWSAGLAILLLLGLAWGVVSQGPELRRYVKRRLVGTPIVLLVLVTISFFLIRAAPGGPFTQEKSVDPATRALQEKQYNFDKSMVEQYLLYIAPVLWEGDLGFSFKQVDRTVNEIVGRHIGPSALLGLAALLIALLVGMTAGLISGIRRNSIFDYASMAVAMIGLAVPTFVVGPMLVLVFAMKLGWFDVSGWGTFKHLVLPAITLALPFAARIARLTRAGMLEVVHQDYIRTARAKGLAESTIVIRHTLKGALIPVVSFMGPAIAQMMTGSLVVEIIFGVPGLGREFVQSALNRDYWLVLGLVLTFGLLLIVFTLIVDILYAFLDPRIRHG